MSPFTEKQKICFFIPTYTNILIKAFIYHGFTYFTGFDTYY